MNLIPLSKASKQTNLPQSYIMHLIAKGRVTYATDATKSAYIVDIDDIIYHQQQVKYRKLTQDELNKVKRTQLLLARGVSQSTIDVSNAIKVGKTVRKVKR